MSDDPEAENEHEKEYPGGRVGTNARIIKDKENDAVIIEEINHGYLNDGYDKFLYEDEGLSKTEQEESHEVTCCVMDCIWYVIFRFCSRCDQIEEANAGRDFGDCGR